MKISALKFTFENCEEVTIPISCFSNLKYKIDGTNIVSFEASIKDNLHIDCYELYDQSVSPVQRISQNDITHIVFIYDDKTNNDYCVLWSDYDIEVNAFQESFVHSYTEIYVSINKKSHAENILQILNNNKIGDKFTDKHGYTYIISDDRNGRYLSFLDGNGEEIKTYLNVMINEFYKE